MRPVQCSGPSKGKGLRSYSHSASNAPSLIPHDLNTMKREREMLRITQRHATSVCTGTHTSDTAFGTKDQKYRP